MSDNLKATALAYLKENSCAVLCTVSHEGGPEASTLVYFVDNELNFYFVSFKGSKKLDNIKMNNQVAIVVGFGPGPVSLQCHGTAQIKDDVSEEVFLKIINQTPYFGVDSWPITRLAKDGFCTIVVKPDKMTYLNLDSKSPDYHEELQTVM